MDTQGGRGPHPLLPSPDQVRADFDRLAPLSDDGWDHNSHYHPFLLRRVPPGCRTALDVGCGTGRFARLLATRAEHVDAVDRSTEMISAALRTVAILASLVLLTSFSLFAIDQAGGASQQAQAEVGSSGAQVLGPAIQGAGAEHGFRGTLDDVDRALVTPIHAFAPGPAGSARR